MNVLGKICYASEACNKHQHPFSLRNASSHIQLKGYFSEYTICNNNQYVAENSLKNSPKRFLSVVNYLQ